MVCNSNGQPIALRVPSRSYPLLQAQLLIDGRLVGADASLQVATQVAVYPSPRFHAVLKPPPPSTQLRRRVQVEPRCRLRIDTN
jgi:hypothetical protein